MTAPPWSGAVVPACQSILVTPPAGAAAHGRHRGPQCAATARDTIDSVLAQTCPAIEHWVIDGASTDGAVKVLGSYGARLPLWTSEPDAGIADAFNKGLRRATGDCLHFLSADDAYASPTAVAEMMAAAAALGWPDVLYGDCLMVDHVTGAPLWKAPKRPRRLARPRTGAAPSVDVRSSPLLRPLRRVRHLVSRGDGSGAVPARRSDRRHDPRPGAGGSRPHGALSMTHATVGYAKAVRAMDAPGRFRTPLGRWLMLAVRRPAMEPRRRGPARAVLGDQPSAPRPSVGV